MRSAKPCSSVISGPQQPDGKREQGPALAARELEEEPAGPCEDPAGEDDAEQPLRPLTELRPGKQARERQLEDDQRAGVCVPGAEEADLLQPG